MSYLINVQTGKCIASTSLDLKSGARVEVAYNVTENAFDANRDYDLVNSFTCKVSNAAKWDNFITDLVAIEINNGEWHIN